MSSKYLKYVQKFCTFWDSLIETDEGLIPLKDAANELLLKLEKVAEFMDKEVIKDENVN